MISNKPLRNKTNVCKRSSRHSDHFNLQITWKPAHLWTLKVISSASLKRWDRGGHWKSSGWKQHSPSCNTSRHTATSTLIILLINCTCQNVTACRWSISLSLHVWKETNCSFPYKIPNKWKIKHLSSAHRFQPSNCTLKMSPSQLPCTGVLSLSFLSTVYRKCSLSMGLSPFSFLFCFCFPLYCFNYRLQ